MKDYLKIHLVTQYVFKLMDLENNKQMNHIKKYNENINKYAKVTEVNSEYIDFDNGIRLQSYHEQDCCEHHYVDFSYVNIDDFDGLEFDLSGDKFFNRINDYGIELIPVSGWGVRIPGYGSNNGYYSSQLSIQLVENLGQGSTLKSFDISECQEISD